MNKNVERLADGSDALPKAPTGIRGFDEVTEGGLPRGRPTLVCGSAGCGKTLFSMEFLVKGATEFNEPGVFVSFEESIEDLTVNVASLGFDLGDLIATKKMALDHVRIERGEIEEAGEYDLEGLFVRLGYAIDLVGAKRIAIDTIEALFSALPSEAILRAELRRLFGWLKDRGVTAIISAERGEGALTRYGLEEYVADCVLLLEQRVHDRVATRHLRVIKYRGSGHGTNEYPFLIQRDGFSVLPITSLGLEHQVSLERVSLGVPRLDVMLGGKGVYRGTSVLVSGTAGAGKSTIAAHAIDAACRRGERCLYFAFEESSSQIIRNMRSVGLDLERWLREGLLQFHAARPTLFGLEMHLSILHDLIGRFDPHLVVIDPVTNFSLVGSSFEVRGMLMRLVDFLKSRHTTAIFNSLTAGGEAIEQTEVGVSSLMDTWILLRFVDESGERNRCVYVLKSRGMPHSNQVREYVITSRGIEIIDVYTGPAGVLTGAARRAQEAKEEAEAIERRQLIERRHREVECKRRALEAQIAAMKAQFEVDSEEMAVIERQEQLRDKRLQRGREEMAALRQGEAPQDREPGARANPSRQSQDIQ